MITVDTVREGVHTAARELLAGGGTLTTRRLFQDDRVWLGVSADG